MKAWSYNRKAEDWKYRSEKLGDTEDTEGQDSML